jgi:hypothetical protein
MSPGTASLAHSVEEDNRSSAGRGGSDSTLVLVGGGGVEVVNGLTMPVDHVSQAGPVGLAG